MRGPYSWQPAGKKRRARSKTKWSIELAVRSRNRIQVITFLALSPFCAFFLNYRKKQARIKPRTFFLWWDYTKPAPPVCLIWAPSKSVTLFPTNFQSGPCIVSVKIFMNFSLSQIQHLHSKAPFNLLLISGHNYNSRTLYNESTKLLPGSSAYN